MSQIDFGLVCHSMAIFLHTRATNLLFNGFRDLLFKMDSEPLQTPKLKAIIETTSPKLKARALASQPQFDVNHLK